MIGQVDERLVQWAKGVLGDGANPTLGVPVDDGEAAVSLYLLEIVDDPLDPLRRSGASAISHPAVLRYLVTTYDKGRPEWAHQLLSTLLYAAFDSNEFVVDLAPVPSDLWLAFHIAPRPAFILRAPMSTIDEKAPAPLVREQEPSVDSSGQMVSFYGLLLGPSDIPIMNAHIQLPNLYRSAVTDHKGRFSLAGVPAAPRKKLLGIKAHRKEEQKEVVETGTPDFPVIIRFDILQSEGGKE